MINYKKKDVGMPYNYNGETYYIEHELFRLNNYKVLEPDDRNNQFVRLSIQNSKFDQEVTPFYDENIELSNGIVLKIAYINYNGEVRVHGYELSQDQEANNKLLAQLQEPINRNFEEQDIDTDNLKIRLNNYLNQIEDNDIKSLVYTIYNHYFEQIYTWPAAVSVHHNIKHGLFLHLMNVTQQAIDIAKNYTDINLDVVIAGAMLHDIGKIKEYTNDGKISDIGKYQDHISLGYNIICEYTRDNKNKYIEMLKHIILSHHGKLEWGSPKPPVNKEAFIVHMADYIDTNMYILHEAYKKVSCGESTYNKYMGTFIVNENIITSNNYDN